MKMPRKHLPPASDGPHPAACADILNLGERDTRWGRQEKVKIVHIIDELDPVTGLPLQVHEMLTASIHESSNFYKRMKVILGGEPRFDANGDFDTDDAIGRTYLITTKRRTTSKGVYANVTDVQPLPAGVPRVAIPLNYVRKSEQGK